MLVTICDNTWNVTNKQALPYFISLFTFYKSVKGKETSRQFSVYTALHIALEQMV